MLLFQLFGPESTPPLFAISTRENLCLHNWLVCLIWIKSASQRGCGWDKNIYPGLRKDIDVKDIPFQLLLPKVLNSIILLKLMLWKMCFSESEIMWGYGIEGKDFAYISKYPYIFIWSQGESPEHVINASWRTLYLWTNILLTHSLISWECQTGGENAYCLWIITKNEHWVAIW